MSATTVPPTGVHRALRVLLVLAASLCVLGLGTAGSTAMGGDPGPAMAGMSAMASTVAGQIPTAVVDNPEIAATVPDPGAGDPMSCPDAGKGQASTCAALISGHPLVHPCGFRLAVGSWSPVIGWARICPAAPALAGIPSPAHPPDLLALNILRV